MTAPTPIKLVVGDDWEFPFTYKDADGNPIDLTGFVPGGDVLWPGGQISSSAPDGEAILLDQTIEENKGKFLLKFDKSASVTVPPRKIGTHLRAYLIDANEDRRSFPAWPLQVDER